MRIWQFPAAMLALFITFPVLAQDTAPGRYTMKPTAEGMLRLDTKTGEVSLCSNTSGTWACRSVPDDRMALESEIDRLNMENRRLRGELGQSGGEGAEKPGLADREGEAPESWLPSDSEIAELKSFLQKMMRELKALVEPPKEENPEKQL